MKPNNLPSVVGTDRRNLPATIRRRPRQPLTDLTAIPETRYDREADDREFLPAALEIMETPVPSRVTLQAYAICGVVLAAIVWSIFGYLTTYAVASGKIQAAGQTKVIQPVKAGQVSAIRARDGDRVKAGAPLLDLNSTDATAARAIIADQLISLRAEVSRRRVEITAAGAQPINTGPTIPWDKDIPQKVREREEGLLKADLSQLAASISDLSAARKVKEASRDSLSVSIGAQNALIAATAEKTGMRQQLETKGWDSHARVLEALEPLKEEQAALSTLKGNLADAEAAIPVIDSQIAQTRATFIAGDAQKLATAQAQIDTLAEQLTQADRTVTTMTLRSPIDGIVHASAITSIGQVVTPGEQVMQVVPEGTPLEIVAYVLNTDIGFVREGQHAAIKVDTFPYARYGTIPGTVTKVAADAISGADALRQQKNGSSPASRGAASNTTPAQQTSDLVFPVLVVPSKSTIDVDGKQVPLSPGMSVVVEIETGKQRAIGYIMYPLVRGAPGT